MNPRRLFATTSLFALALPGRAEVKLTEMPGKIHVEIDGQPFTDFYVSGVNKPYLHPLRSATGKAVTRLYPMEEKAGEAKDHIHHRGLWITHGDVNGFDFWSNDPSQWNAKKGKVVLEKVVSMKSGKKNGKLHAIFAWQDSSGKTLLREDRTMVFHADPKLRTIDFDVKFTGVEKSRFNDTKEGMFAMRVAAELDGKHSGVLRSHDGKSGEKLIWGKRYPWVDYAGTVEGEQLGIAIFDHPSNPKHPPFWHSRDYGLFATNIFGEHDFFADKSIDGGKELMPGETWRFRVRVVIHPGDGESAGLAKMFEAWASSKK